MKTASANLEPATSGTQLLHKRPPFAMSRLGPYVAAAVILLGGPSALASVNTLSYWRMGENDPNPTNSGAANGTNDPTGGRTMTLQGAASYSTDVSPTAAARVGSSWSMRFSGSTSGTSTLVSSLTDNFGIELWVKPVSTAAGNQCLAYNGNSSSNGWGLYRIGNQYQGLFGGRTIFGTATAIVGTWTHLALVRNNGTATLYVNGVAAGTTTLSPYTPTGIFAAAAQPQNTSLERFDGWLDEVRVFTFAPGAFNPDTDLNNFTVTTTADEFDTPSGAILSLREAVRDAAAAPGANIITFAPALSGQTITLTTVLGGEIILDSAITIDATSLPNGITIDGGPGFNRIFSIPASKTVTLNRLTLTGGDGGGSAPSGYGGAIYNASSLLTLNHCFFHGNSTDGYGGGIYNNLSSPTLTNCSFQGNSAYSWGGGIYNSFSSPTLTNCSFQGNNAGSLGGGIFNNTSSSPTLTNCSFQGNNAGNGGGGIFNYTTSSSPTLNNCIIWKNKDNSGVGTAASSVGNLTSSIPTYSHCLIQGYSKAALDNGVLTRNNLEPTDPLFVREVDPSLAPTTGGDVRLRAGSPAIDAGDNTKNPTPIDLGGKPRFIDGNMDNIATIDLGAHEWRRVFVNAAVSVGNQDGTSWANAFPQLQSALAATQAGDEIWVATGTYFPDEGTGQADNVRTSTFTLKPGVAIYGGFPDTGRPAFADRNPATNLTTLSGDIDGNGNLSNNAYHLLTASGAAITASSILDGFTITAGNANGSSPNSSGGGMILNSASPTLNNCSFQGNSATSQGGGIYNNNSSPALNNCSFQGNSATSQGGGMFNQSSSPTLNNCSFQGNSVISAGGGILNWESSPTLTNCSFQSNSAHIGGGIYNLYSSPTLTNCSFQGNRANTSGGGILNWESSPTLNNCIIWKNKDGTGTGTATSSVENGTGSTPTYSRCIIDNSGGSAAWVTSLGTDGGNNLDADPLFVREVDPSSAPTTGGDLRLRSDSPAIDAGSNSLNPTTTDLGGKPRFIDGDMDNIATIDLGAHEWRRVFVNAAVSVGNQDGTSWANAFTHLQSALAATQAGDEIWVATGTYFPDEGTGQADNVHTSTFALKPGVAIYGGFPGTGTPVFADRNPATNLTTLSGDIGTAGDISDNTYNVLTASGAAITASTILDGFTITAGNANAWPNTTGGGMYLNSASPTLTNCSFRGNSAGNGGGGIYNLYSSPTLTNCSFQSNSAGNGYGGGIFNSVSSPTLNNCSFQGNSASLGGGIYNDFSSPTLNNCSFHGNSADNGGGILNYRSSSPTLNNCSFQGNSASSNGGGIYNNSSSPTLNNCIIWKNKDSSGTGTASTSVFKFNSTPTHSHCLIQGYPKAQLDADPSPDTNLEPNDPLFVREVDPNSAPTTTGGDLRLLTGSPALNVGNNDANSTLTDLAGNPRKVGTIDLGAYEGNVNATFALLHPTLDPSGDANGNGITNFGDYAAGGNPSAPDDPSLRPKLIGNQLTFSFRNNATDIAKEFQKSTTLLPGSWNPLVLTTDHTVSSSTSSGGRSLQTLTLDSTLLSNPKLFFRQEFTSISPQ